MTDSTNKTMKSAASTGFLVVHILLSSASPVFDMMESRCLAALHLQCSSMCPDKDDHRQLKENGTSFPCCLLSGCASCFANLSRGSCGQTGDKLIDDHVKQFEGQFASSHCTESDKLPSATCLTFFLARHQN